MADIIGFKLIRQTPLSLHYFSCANGMVDYRPVRKYQVDKRNAFDPSIRHLRNEYREDTFELKCALLPSQYATLMNFLTASGKLYLQYTSHPGVKAQFPVVVTRLPECPDDLHEYPELVKFSLESSYVGSPGYIDFGVIATEYENEFVVTN